MTRPRARASDGIRSERAVHGAMPEIISPLFLVRIWHGPGRDRSDGRTTDGGTEIATEKATPHSFTLAVA